MASNAATYRQPTSSHYIFQTPPSCAPTSLAVARAQRLHHGSRSKRTSRSPRHIDARKVHSRGPPRKPFQARRCSPGPMAAFEGAALACSASAGRCMSQDWSRLDEDDLTLQLLRRWPSRTEDAPARVQGSTRPGRGSGRCRWRMRTTPASRTGICSVVIDFPRGHRTTESHDAPGELRRSFGGRQPLGPSTGGIQWPALYGAGPSAWPTADHRQSRPATRVAVLMLISVFNALPRRSSVILRSGSPMCRPSFLALDAFVHDPNSRFPP